MSDSLTPLQQAWALLAKNSAVEAESILKKVIQENPAGVDQWFLLGVAQHRQNKIEDALGAFSAALKFNPQHIDALNARAMMLSLLTRHKEALECYQLALRCRPDDPKILTNIAIVFESLDEQAQALDHYDRALTANPLCYAARLNRGALLMCTGRLEEGLENNQTLIADYPDDAEANFNCAETLLGLCRYEACINACTKVLKINPQHVRGLINRGMALSALARFDEAQQVFTQASGISPNEVKTYFDMLASHVRRASGLPDPRLVYLHHHYDRQSVCDWRERDAYIARFVPLVETLCREDSFHDATLIFESLALPVSQSIQLELARKVATHIDKRAQPKCATSLRRNSTAKIKLGYISPDFRKHPVGYLAQGLFTLHDRAKFEVFGYALYPGDRSDIHRRIEKGCDVFRDLSACSDDDAISKIETDEIDILIDLAGYTRYSRAEILARRPAPLQVNYLGYPGTMGADFIQYRITDHRYITPSQAAFWSERMVYLPHTAWIFDPTSPTLSPSLRLDPTQCGLRRDGFVFCCFNNPYKIEPQVFAIWMRLLLQMPGSVLWLKPGNAVTIKNLRYEAEKRGVSSERLCFIPADLSYEYMQLYQYVDLFLDTLYYSAGTIALDALWSGVPLLACPGESGVSRGAASALHAIGMDELIAGTVEDYEAMALRLAQNPQLLKTIRDKLKRNRTTHALFDTPSRVRELEAAYTMMMDRHHSGLAPASFDVKPLSGTA